MHSLSHKKGLQDSCENDHTSSASYQHVLADECRKAGWQGRAVRNVVRLQYGEERNVRNVERNQRCIG